MCLFVFTSLEKQFVLHQPKPGTVKQYTGDYIAMHSSFVLQCGVRTEFNHIMFHKSIYLIKRR